ncbi:MAG: cytochrome ubiquinol oxidase subunit I, partial [Desulfobacteraceae bacterium]
DFMAVITQPFAWHTIVHTLSGAYLLSAFFVMGISAWFLLRKREVSLFTRSFRLALTFGLIFTLVTVIHGHYNGGEVAAVQPAKLAAMESHWETQKNAPIYLLAIPDPANERNAVEIGPLPGLLSLLAYHSPSAEVKGLKAWPREERPPVTLVFAAFKIMVGLGMLFLLLMIIGWFLRHRLVEAPWYLKIMLYAIPLPYIAIQAGWVVTEVGRQPWIVYGLMKTSQAASPVAASQVAATLAAFVVVYGILAFIYLYLIRRTVVQGPEPVKA